jgi:hypothetical protein
MKQHSKTLENLQIVVPKLNAIKTIISGIPVILFRPGGASEQDFANCGNQLQILEEHVKDLKKLRNLGPLTDQITRETATLAGAMVELQKATLARTFCMTLVQPTSLLSQIIAQKKQELSAGTTVSNLKSNLAALKQQMRPALDDTIFLQLSNKLKAIDEAVLAQQVDAAYQEFLNLANQALAQSNINFDAARQRYWIAHGIIDRAINDSHQLDPNIEQQARRGIREAIVQAQQHLQTLERWEHEHVKEIPYINFSPIDMKGLQDWATGLVYGRVKERLDGLMKLLRREETYRYGILNHLLLIPYVQAMRSNNPVKSTS